MARARSTPLRRTADGRLASKKSKTGNPRCSSAMSAIARKVGTPGDFKQAAQCRQMTRDQSKARVARDAGHEARAQAMEHRAKKGDTTRDRMTRARELVARRQAERAAAASAPSPARRAITLRRVPKTPAQVAARDAQGRAIEAEQMYNRSANLRQREYLKGKVDAARFAAGARAEAAQSARPRAMQPTAIKPAPKAPTPKAAPRRPAVRARPRDDESAELGASFDPLSRRPPNDGPRYPTATSRIPVLPGRAPRGTRERSEMARRLRHERDVDRRTAEVRKAEAGDRGRAIAAARDARIDRATKKTGNAYIRQDMAASRAGRVDNARRQRDKARDERARLASIAPRVPYAPKAPASEAEYRAALLQRARQTVEPNGFANLGHLRTFASRRFGSANAGGRFDRAINGMRLAKEARMLPVNDRSSHSSIRLGRGIAGSNVTWQFLELPARPSPRQQAAAHRATKGDATTRAGVLASKARKRVASAKKAAARATQAGRPDRAVAATRKALANAERVNKLLARRAGVDGRTVIDVTPPATVPALRRPSYRPRA